MQQNDLLLPWRTALENALLGPELRGERRGARRLGLPYILPTPSAILLRIAADCADWRLLLRHAAVTLAEARRGIDREPSPTR